VRVVDVLDVPKFARGGGKFLGNTKREQKKVGGAAGRIAKTKMY